MSRAPERPTDLPPPPPMGRIVQVRGASGSGKTTLVRHVMRELGPPVKWKVEGRKQPIALTFARPGLRPLCVVGNYQDGVATGGVDTIPDKETPYRIAREAVRQGFDVLLEGIFISIEYWRTLYLHEAGFERHDVLIDLSVEECTEQVHRRQEAAGKPRKPLKQMADYHPRMVHTLNRLRAVGVPNLHVCTSSDIPDVPFDARCEMVRQSALELVQELLS